MNELILKNRIRTREIEWIKTNKITEKVGANFMGQYNDLEK